MRVFALVFLLVLAGCASGPKFSDRTDRELLAAACPNLSGKKITGGIWAKIDSPEMSGQFPATVLVEFPTKLAVEVTNLIGAPQAWLTIENGKTDLRFTAENEKEYGKPPRSEDMLGGLPLEFAPSLFAGGVPCPRVDKNQNIRVKRTDEGIEVVTVDLRTRASARYAYDFISYAGAPWVHEVRWERLAKNGKQSVKSSLITIDRDEPDDSDGAPKRWSALSSRGRLQVRWKDRSATTVNNSQSSESIVK